MDVYFFRSSPCLSIISQIFLKQRSMEIEKSSLLTPEQLEYGLVHNSLDRDALDKLITTHVHENENIDTLVNFFLQYLPGNRSMTEFINRSKF